MAVSNRELSKSQIYVNLYIRYKRDFACDTNWIAIKPYKCHEKLAFEIFKSHVVIPNLSSIRTSHEQKNQTYENQRDGRKKKTLKKDVDKLAAQLPRYEKIKKESLFQSTAAKLNIGIAEIKDWIRLQNIEENQLLNNHGYVSIRGIEVDAQELNEFIYDFQETSWVFQINNPFDNVILVFELMRGHWSYGCNQEEGDAVENRLVEWRLFCNTADDILEHLKQISYYKQGKSILFAILEKKQPENVKEHTREYKLLKMIIDYEKQSGKQVQLTSQSVQEIHLILSLCEFFPEKTIKKLFKYLRQ